MKSIKESGFSRQSTRSKNTSGRVCRKKDNQTIVKRTGKGTAPQQHSDAPLAASIMNAKYVNGLPLYRISQEFLSKRSNHSPFTKSIFSAYSEKNNRFFKGGLKTMDQCTHEVRAEYWKKIIQACGQRPAGQSAKKLDG